jgi:hypothetical protein
MPTSVSGVTTAMSTQLPLSAASGPTPHGIANEYERHDVGGRDRHREPDHPDDRRRNQRGEHQIALGIAADNVGKALRQAGQSRDADNNAGGGAGGRDAKHAGGTFGQRAHELGGHKRHIAPQVADGDRQQGRPEDGQNGEKPSSIRAMIETREPKWNQYSLVTRQSAPFCTSNSPPPPYLAASSSTIVRILQ